jgi:hypothetical protein
MPPVSDDQRIRKGLKFLTRADKAVIRASVPLERLTGNANPPGIHTLLNEFSFSVGSNDYSGVMTQEQYTYLQGFTGSLGKFANAISSVLINSNNNVVGALSDLNAGLGPPMVRNRAVVGPRAVVAPAVGCCSYDTDEQSNGIAQTYCEGGLQGQWSPNPCHGDPLGKQSKPSHSKR